MNGFYKVNIAVIATILSISASAHTGVHTKLDVVTGWMHMLTEIDHVIFMLMVGLLMAVCHKVFFKRFNYGRRKGSNYNIYK